MWKLRINSHENSVGGKSPMIQFKIRSKEKYYKFRASPILNFLNALVNYLLARVYFRRG